MNTASPLDRVASALSRHDFHVHRCADRGEAAALFLSNVSTGQRVGVGGSVTVQEMGLAESLRAKGCEVLWHWEVPPEERPALLRRAMEADHYICSVNALTQDGRLVLMDGTGNRLAALCYGPARLSIFIGQNKLCGAGLLAAMTRIKQTACPLNARRLGLTTPCARTGTCDDMHCMQSMCHGMLSMERPFNGREADIYLIEEDLGY